MGYLTINGRDVDVHVEVMGRFSDWDDMFTEAYIDRAEWVDTGEEFTEQEYLEHEEILNEISAGEIYWNQMV